MSDSLIKFSEVSLICKDPKKKLKFVSNQSHVKRKGVN